MTQRDITPKGSAAPVYLDDTPREPVNDLVDIDALSAEHAANRKSALAKLRKLGLTEEEALALAGG